MFFFCALLFDTNTFFPRLTVVVFIDGFWYCLLIFRPCILIMLFFLLITLMIANLIEKKVLIFLAMTIDLLQVLLAIYVTSHNTMTRLYIFFSHKFYSLTASVFVQYAFIRFVIFVKRQWKNCFFLILRDYVESDVIWTRSFRV